MAEIDVEDENILTSIFKDTFPESWQENPEFVKYLVELSSYGVQKLAQEPDRLAEEKSQILEETQDLAFHNYTTFIQTANCSKEIFQDFQIIEQHLDDLLGKLPTFSEECNKVVQKAQEISSSRRMNTLTLQRHTHLLEVLEMPQLMDTCVRNGYYEEALELAAHVRRLEKKHSSIPVIMSIVEEVKASTQLMLGQLIQQLRTNLQLPACLRVIGYLRRMEVFSEPELRIKFLQARDSWFQGILDAIPRDDHEDPIVSSSREDVLPDSALFHSWVVQKVSQFLTTLEEDLERGVGGRLDSLLGQCMYFGLSFSRVGADFRGLVAPVFQRAALRYFEAALQEANTKFEENMQSYNLLGLTSSGGLSYGSSSQAGQLYPPTVLLDFYPLAAYCNHILSAFNDLRLCAPVNLACQVGATLSRSLFDVNRVILAFHRAEETTFNQRERAQFEQFCATYVADLLPYLNRCLQALFPAAQLAHTLGVSLSEVNKMANLGLVDLNPVLAQVQHLMPIVKEELPPAAAPPSPPSQTLLASSLPPPAESRTSDAAISSAVESVPTSSVGEGTSSTETALKTTEEAFTLSADSSTQRSGDTPVSQPALADVHTSETLAEPANVGQGPELVGASASSQIEARTPDSSILQSDTIDLDAVPDAWLSGGEDVLSGVEGGGIDIGLASDLATGLTLDKPALQKGGDDGESSVKKQD
ncbi:hypothetical protein BaRGS_00021183 [Batillaria attramentaria]|uniref:Conserved oligomeric Golgi complex subunit 8 n=1 Tax=Batillaria attramentaria TaxID=370345 RepID=A0ABD0KKH4_9CAEN